MLTLPEKLSYDLEGFISIDVQEEDLHEVEARAVLDEGQESTYKNNYSNAAQRILEKKLLMICISARTELYLTMNLNNKDLTKRLFAYGVQGE